MEMKTGHLTASDAQKAANDHYEAENTIMAHVKNMSLAGKKKLATKMPDHVTAAEDEASKE